MNNVSQTIILSFITLLLTQPILAANTATCNGNPTKYVVYADDDKEVKDDTADGTKGEKEGEEEPDCD